MTKSLSIALTVAALGLSACAPATTYEPVSDQDYGGKFGSGSNYGSTGHTVTRSAACPDGAYFYRGNLFCPKAR